MKSTLYLKFIIVYFIFGFLSLFTVGALTAGLFPAPLNHAISSNLYKEANMVANDYLPDYFSEQISLYNVHTAGRNADTFGCRHLVRGPAGKAHHLRRI